MKKSIYLIFASLLVFGFCNQTHTPSNQNIDEFLADLSYANSHLRGDLYLFEFEDDLSPLSYNHYLELLKENETKNESTKGITAIIQKSEKHLFATKKNSFLIAIYSKELNAILYDDAITSGIDSVHLLNSNKQAPDLIQFVSKAGF